MLACLFGLVVVTLVPCVLLWRAGAKQEEQELQVLTILGGKRLTTDAIVDALVTYHIETQAKVLIDNKRVSKATSIHSLLAGNLVAGPGVWPVLPVLKRLARKGCVRCMNQDPPRWIMADAGKARIAVREKKDA